MRTNHVDEHINAYLDNQLSAELQHQVEIHIKQCPACARLLAEARRVERELKPVMRAALGQPVLPSQLRHQVQTSIRAQESGRWFWTTPARFLNAVGTVAVVALLAFGVYVVIRGQIPGLSPQLSAGITTMSSSRGGGDKSASTAATPTATAQTQSALVGAETTPGRISKGDSLSVDPLPPAAVEVANSSPDRTKNADKISETLSPSGEGAADISEEPGREQLPGGTIAFALFDGKMYQIQLINPDGTNLRPYPLPGVSEPALHPGNNDTVLAFRSWNDPDGPRALVSSDLLAERPESITHFWEDGQPDWSPTENRIIFASQRESDRRWRLYSVWGDGSLEVNLRREGKSPTFAPDGYRFAFEACDETGNRCGLWLTDLEHSEQEAHRFLENQWAKAPDWSPVSEEVVYMANPAGNWNVYVINSDGTNLRRLTDDSASDGLPVWSPNGEWIAFVSDRGGQWGIWLLHVATGALHPTTTFEGGTLTPPNRTPYSEQGERFWWDEQLSWN